MSGTVEYTDDPQDCAPPLFRLRLPVLKLILAISGDEDGIVLRLEDARGTYRIPMQIGTARLFAMFLNEAIARAEKEQG